MDESAIPSRRKTWWPLFMVLALALGVRTWTVARSQVAARDSIGFIKYALRYESESFVHVLQQAQQPPAYPLAILITSWPVRAIVGETTPQAMAMSAQIASSLFGVLLVLPMVAFGAEIVDRRFGLVTAALFQCLPAWVRFTSDGISESTFLFFTATSLWLAARAFRTSSWQSMTCCGLTAGLAFLTRPEGLEIIIAVAIVAAALGMLGYRSWRYSGLALATVAAGFLVFFGPFVAITGRITNKPTGRILMGDPTVEQSYFGVAKPGPALLAVWAGATDKNKVVWAAQALMTEVASSSRQVGFALSILGLILWRQRIRNPAGGSVMIVLAAMHSILLIRMASQIGYLSERHVALIVLTGCYPATLGLVEIVEKIRGFGGIRLRLSGGMALAGVIVLAFCAACPSLAKSMHNNRAGHRAAGEWLAHHMPADAAIRDPFCWAQYYAGRDFHNTAASDPDEQFVIVERSDNQHSRLPLIPEVKAKAAKGEMVFHWPENRPPNEAQVAVYRWLRQKNQDVSQSELP